MKKDKYLNSFTISGEDLLKGMLSNGVFVKGKDEETGEDMEVFYAKNDEIEMVIPIYPNRKNVKEDNTVEELEDEE